MAKVFSISGSMKLGSRQQEFQKKIEAETEEYAKTELFKYLGSKHRLQKRFINIAEIAEITDHSVVLERDAKREHK